MGGSPCQHNFLYPPDIVTSFIFSTRHAHAYSAECFSEWSQTSRSVTHTYFGRFIRGLREKTRQKALEKSQADKSKQRKPPNGGIRRASPGS